MKQFFDIKILIECFNCSLLVQMDYYKRNICWIKYAKKINFTKLFDDLR